MMTRTFSPWLSWKTLDRLHNEMNDFFGNLQEQVTQRYPLVRIYHNDDEVLVSAELPGFDLEDLDINVKKDQLILSGKRNEEELPENTVRHLDERGMNSFTRTLKLPFPVSAEGAEAKYARGILTVKLVRPEEEKPQRINVQKG